MNNNQNNGFPNNQYPNNQYPNNQYSNNQYPNNQYSNNQYSNNQYLNNQYPNNQYQTNQYQNNPNMQYSNNQQTPYRYNNVPVKKQSSGKFVLMVIGIVLGAIVLMSVCSVMLFRLIFGGNGGNNSAQKKEWVQKMNDTFPDDEFTFVSYDKIGAPGLWAVTTKNVIIVSSKNYPGKKITVGWNEDQTKLVTDYNYFKYKDDLGEYYKSVIGRYFSPDDMDVSYLVALDYKTDLKSYTFDEFRKEKAGVYSLIAQMKYTGDFPSEEEATRAIESIIHSLNEEVNMTIYFSHTSVDNDDNAAGNERYDLAMDSPKKIKYLDHYTINWIKTKTDKDIRRDNKNNIYENKDVD